MSSSGGFRDNDCRIFVGNLPPEIRTRDLEDIFYKFGKIVYVDLKPNREREGPSFGFVEFEDHRDAEDAVKARDGYNFDEYRIRVEFPKGSSRGPPVSRDRFGGGYGGGRGGGGGGGYGGSRGGRYVQGRSGGGPARRTEYRVAVTGLPATGSWQDLKDHMRDVGEVCYADVDKSNGSGVVEFLRHEDMKEALKKLDDSKFRSHEGETAYIRVKEERGGEGGGSGSDRYRSSGGGGGRRSSPSYSPLRRSRSHSRSRS